MKILLVKPHAPNKLSFTGLLDAEPLELEYLHTVLQENNYEDYIFDCSVEQIPLTKVLKRENPDIIAITGYITHENVIKKFAEQSKLYNPNIVTIVGGVHAQLNYERFYNKDIDYIARSECLQSFISLIKYIDKGSGRLEDINGICYKKNNQYITNELTPFDINTLPIPDRSYFYKHKNKFRYLDLSPVATIKTSSSCPFDCNFCYCTLLNDGKYRTRDLTLVLDEIEGIECDTLQIADDDFLVDRERILQFIDGIKKRNINKKFLCYARADFVANNADIIKLLADIGFTYFLVGLEAVNDKALNSYNKRTTQDLNRKCVEIIENTTASCIGLLIVGIDATKKDFEDIVTWVLDTKIKHVTVSIFTPIPGTKLYEDNKHLITSKNIEDWDFLPLVMEPTNLTRSQFYREYYKMLVKLYNIAKGTGTYDFMDIKYYVNMSKKYLIQSFMGV